MSKQVTRRTQQQRRDDTERRVVDAAIRLIAQSGSRAVTLAEVGRAAGYSRGIVHHHFGSREQLLIAVVADTQRFDVPASEGDGLDQLTALIQAYLRNLHDRAPASQAFLLLWAEAVASDPVLSPLFATRDESFRSLLGGHIRAGIADGSIRPDTDPDAAAVILLGLLRGIGMQLVSAGGRLLIDTLAAQTVQLLHSALAVREDRPWRTPTTTSDVSIFPSTHRGLIR